MRRTAPEDHRACPAIQREWRAGQSKRLVGNPKAPFPGPFPIAGRDSNPRPSGYEPDPEARPTTWGTVSSGFPEIEIGWDRLDSVGLLAPFLAPAFCLVRPQSRRPTSARGADAGAGQGALHLANSRPLGQDLQRPDNPLLCRSDHNLILRMSLGGQLPKGHRKVLGRYGVLSGGTLMSRPAPLTRERDQRRGHRSQSHTAPLVGSATRAPPPPAKPRGA